jgi:hypothetical protein
LTNTSSGTQAWTRNIGNVLIKEVRYEIGTQTMDKHYTNWLHIWGELTTPPGLRDTYNVMIGNTKSLTTLAATVDSAKLYIPLQFDFCRNPGLALPMIALQYHDVKLFVTFRDFSECYVVDSGAVTTADITNAKLFCDYIYLDSDERKKFAQKPQETLIEQLQFTGRETFSSTNVRQKLNFNHPVKAIYVLAQLESNVASGANRWTDFTNSGTGAADTYYDGDSPITNLLLQVNGHDRFTTRDAAYFNLVQPYYHFTNGPSTGVHVYSFALKPEEHQPSGSLNFSRVDNVILALTMASSAATSIYTFASNYNIRRVMSGMAGLSYSS